jgi:ATP-dependent Clp protease adaptor protein ClpS
LDRAQGVAPLRVTAAAAGVIEAPIFEEKLDDQATPGWIVTVFDNDTNTYEQVMAILMLATSCTAEEAYMEAWEIDHLGKSVVHQACEKDCCDVAAMIAKIGIKVVVSEE